jgi:phosphocarrier protein HPr
MVSQTVSISQTDGWHARPASEFAKAVVSSGVSVTVSRPGQTGVRGDSVLSLLALGAKHGEKLLITVNGINEEQVLNQLTSLF